MKIGVIKERKVPSDSRVCLTPAHCRILLDRGWEVLVEPSDVRVFTDQEYVETGVTLSSDMQSCDILIGVKEVPIDQLIPHKTYFFFSHTFKEQVYNRGLLQAVLQNKIRLLDYEAITDINGARLIAFGRFAGIVGAHNGVYTYLKKAIPRMKDFFNYQEAKEFYSSLSLPKMKVVLSGTGRVASGAAMVLDDMGFKKVGDEEYLSKDFDHAVYTQINSFQYAKRKDGSVPDRIEDFYQNPGEYRSDFARFAAVSDLFINGIYWDPRAPAFFDFEDMQGQNFKIDTIADVTCDIAPDSSVPTTLRPSTIDDPIYGVGKADLQETEAFLDGSVNMMAIDNLPNELPRDASTAFGDMFIEHVLDQLLEEDSSLLHRAAITTRDGELNEPFSYLKNFVENKPR